MAPKKVQGYVKLQIIAAKATPAPPVGPRAGTGAGSNIMEFCKQFNERTSKDPGDGGSDDSGRHYGVRGPYVLVYYEDASGSGVAVEGCRDCEGLGHNRTRDKVGKVTEKQIQEIAKQKDAGYECGFCGIGGEEHSRYGTVDGHRSPSRKGWLRS